MNDNEKSKATLQVTYKSCLAKGLRGACNIVIMLDEVAHFKDEGGWSKNEVRGILL